MILWVVFAMLTVVALFAAVDRWWLRRSRDLPRSSPSQPSHVRVSRTHDYTRQTWGHAVNIMRVEEQGQRLFAMVFAGWGQGGIHKGDYLILPNGDKTTRYLVTEASWCGDPDDGWMCSLRFAPRTEDAFG